MKNPDPHAILSAWHWEGPADVQPIRSGLINRSFTVLVDNRATAVLQWLKTDIVPPEVNLDIEIVTSRLVERGVATPRLMHTRSGELWTSDRSGGVWRCLTHVGDRTIERFSHPGEARSAGLLVARFHAAVADFDHRLASPRHDAQDTEKHLANLHSALVKHPDHRFHDEVQVLADRIDEVWSQWSGPTDLPHRLIHGDLKISNVRFEGDQALALIDLDTFAFSTLDVELGDAMRSWCNSAGEDSEQAFFDLDLFAAAMQGYGAGADLVSDDEWNAVVPGIERITLNLCARFAADALEERYFGWDPEFGGHGEHNLLRAKGQMSLLLAVQKKRSHAENALIAARSG